MGLTNVGTRQSLWIDAVVALLNNLIRGRGRGRFGQRSAVSGQRSEVSWVAPQARYGRVTCCMRLRPWWHALLFMLHTPPKHHTHTCRGGRAARTAPAACRGRVAACATGECPARHARHACHAVCVRARATGRLRLLLLRAPPHPNTHREAPPSSRPAAATGAPRNHPHPTTGRRHRRCACGAARVCGRVLCHGRIPACKRSGS